MSLASLLMSLPTIACGPPETTTEFTHAEFELSTVVGEVLNQSPAIGMPWDLEVSDSILWIADASGDPMVHAVDVNTGGLIRSLGRRGGGPGEFDGQVFGLSVRQGDVPGSVWAYDLEPKRLTRLDVGASSSTDYDIISLTSPGTVIRAFWVGADIIMGTGTTAQDRFVRFDSAGLLVDEISGVLVGDSSVPEAERAKVSFTGAQGCEHGNQGFAVIYFSIGRIELYDAQGALRRVAAVPYPSDAQFAHDPHRNRWSQIQDRRWYVSCTGTVDHLYALFSGRRYDAFDPYSPEADVGRFIHIFSWDTGALVGVLKLDRAVSALSMNGDGSVLYASSEADAKVYRFVLSRALLRSSANGA